MFLIDTFHFWLNTIYFHEIWTVDSFQVCNKKLIVWLPQFGCLSGYCFIFLLKQATHIPGFEDVSNLFESIGLSDKTSFEEILSKLEIRTSIPQGSLRLKFKTEIGHEYL